MASRKVAEEAEDTTSVKCLKALSEMKEEYKYPKLRKPVGKVG